MVWQKMPNPRGPPCQASMLLTAVALLAKASCSKASFFMTTVLGRYLGCCWYVAAAVLRSTFPTVKAICI